MDLSNTFMDNSIIEQPAIYYETRFRTPIRAERDIGLWVDRLGTNNQDAQQQKLRQLGQFACVFIDSGGGTLTTAHYGVFPLPADTLFFIFPEEPTFYNPDKHWQHHFIVFNGPQAHELCRLGYFSTGAMIIPQAREPFFEAFVPLGRLMGDESLTAVLQRKCLMEQLILNLYRINRYGVSAADDRRIRQALAYLEEHYYEPLVMDELARQHHLSPAHFRRLFKARTGRTAQEFLMAKRISQAKKLLSQGCPIKQVAPRVGYLDVFYFMRIFKKMTGVTAKNFRKNVT